MCVFVQLSLPDFFVINWFLKFQETLNLCFSLQLWTTTMNTRKWWHDYQTEVLWKTSNFLFIIKLWEMPKVHGPPSYEHHLENITSSSLCPCWSVVFPGLLLLTPHNSRIHKYHHILWSEEVQKYIESSLRKLAKSCEEEGALNSAIAEARALSSLRKGVSELPGERERHTVVYTSTQQAALPCSSHPDNHVARKQMPDFPHYLISRVKSD